MRQHFTSCGLKYWSFSFSISPSNEHSGLISFRNDWFDLLTVQGTLKSLLQHHNSKGSVLRRSAFFMVQLSHPCMTNGKAIAFTILKFVGKVMPLLFNMLSRFVYVFSSSPKSHLQCLTVTSTGHKDRSEFIWALPTKPMLASRSC